MSTPDPSLFEFLEPIAKLSAGRKQELAEVCYLEKVGKGINPLRMNVSKTPQLIYLIKGNLGLRFNNDKKLVLRAGSPASKHPINNGYEIKDLIALTEIEIMRVDTELLDIMMTWDQLSSAILSHQPIKNGGVEGGTDNAKPKDWLQETRVFSAANLQSGVFSRLPAANIEQMFKRMERLEVEAGDSIIEQGAEGDYYYLIEHGVAMVSKVTDLNDAPKVLAELGEGEAFGEEALASDNKRSATVSMKTDGRLLRLNKKDFVELLKEPLITQVSRGLAESKVAAGAIWADVRMASEYQYDHLAGAISLPLSDIRQLAKHLEPTKHYVLYCQTGRRSSAAAFILVERGFNVVVLAGGTRAD